MSKPNILLKTYLNVSNGDFEVEDVTDYPSLGIAAGVVVIALKLYTPAGLLYINPSYTTPSTAPNISPGNGLFNYNPMPLVGGKLMKGVYKVVANWQNTVTGAKYEYTFEQDIQHVLPCVDIEHTIDCFCGKITSTDKTPYGTSEKIDYLHTIKYPQRANTNDAETALLEWTDDKLANGTYVTTIESNRNFIYGAFVVADKVVGHKDAPVDCSTQCRIKCGFNKLMERWTAARKDNPTEAARLMPKVVLATGLLYLIRENRSCGDTTNTECFQVQLKELLGDCGCNDCHDDDPIWVTGVCGSNGGPGNAFDYVFEVSDNFLTVDVTEVGSTRTVSYGVNPDAIDALVNTDIGLALVDVYDQIAAVLSIASASWFANLDTSALAGFGSLTEEVDMRQYIITLLAQLQASLFPLPIATNDYSTITYEDNGSVEKNVTANDFFSSDVTVEIGTVINGTAEFVGTDTKTIRYNIPNGFTGTATVEYTITDGRGNVSSAVWTIVVNGVTPVSCVTLVPVYTVVPSATAGGFLNLVMNNNTNMGTNVLTAEQYIVDVRDAANNILHTYTVNGSIVSDPTSFTTPHPILGTWDNVRVQMLITSESSTGDACGTISYESPSPYSLTNVGTSWFDGTTPPASLGFTSSMTEIEKKDALMLSIDEALNGVADVEALIAALPAVNSWTDVSSGVTVDAAFGVVSKSCKRWADGTISIYAVLTYSGTVAASHAVLGGLPLGFALYKPIENTLSGDTSETAELLFSGLGVISVGGTLLPDLSAAGLTTLYLYHEYKENV